MKKKLSIFFKANIIIIAVVGGTLLSLLFPSAGQELEKLKLISPLIIIVFFCQGTGVKGISSKQIRHYSLLLLIAFITSQVLAPILALTVAKLIGWQSDSLIGFMLICCMAPTLVSGTIISEQAGGDRTAALIITIIINIVAVFTIPLSLSWSLGASVSIEALPLFKKLIYLVLIPALLGHLFRRWQKPFVEKHKSFFKYLPIVCLASVIYMSMSRQNEVLHQLTLRMLGEYSIASIIVHLALLFFAYRTALFFKADIASARSVAICSSQKTIPITIAIWTSQFSEFSLALLPAIVFHLCQIYCDGFIAKKWAKK